MLAMPALASSPTCMSMPLLHAGQSAHVGKAACTFGKALAFTYSLRPQHAVLRTQQGSSQQPRLRAALTVMASAVATKSVSGRMAELKQQGK